MIVRIFTEGQYRVDDSHHAKLDELDDTVVAAVEGGDEDGYHAASRSSSTTCATNGEVLADDELESLAGHPAAGRTSRSSRPANEFTGEGLIPDPPA